MVDLGTGNNNKINWALTDKQEFIDIVETVYRGARKGRGLVVSPKGEEGRVLCGLGCTLLPLPPPSTSPALHASLARRSPLPLPSLFRLLYQVSLLIALDAPLSPVLLHFCCCK